MGNSTDLNNALASLRYQPDGLEILQGIRQCESTSNIPVLTLSAKDDELTRTTLLNLGANDFLQKPVSANELVARVRNNLSYKVAYDQQAMISAKLQADVLEDSLTGIANRRAFDFEIDRKMIEWERQRTPLALLLIDIDNFKSINDRCRASLGKRFRLIPVEAPNLTAFAHRFHLLGPGWLGSFVPIIPVLSFVTVLAAAK